MVGKKNRTGPGSPKGPRHGGQATRQRSLGGHFRARITGPKQAVLGATLVTLMAFGLKYTLFNTDDHVPLAKGTHRVAGKELREGSYAITGASWATGEDRLRGFVAPPGGIDSKTAAGSREFEADPEEVRRMQEAAERWQGLDIAVRDH